MPNDRDMSTLEAFRAQTRSLAERHGLMDDSVEVVSARPLTPDEAIGRTERSDFPLLKGKEFMMESRYRGSRGQAFTAMPGEFQGKVREVLSRSLVTDFDRALLVSTANALLSYLGVASQTVHCRDDGPKRCAAEVIEYVLQRFGRPKIAFIGFQPALISALAAEFELRVTDMDPDNIGQDRLGVLVESAEKTGEVIDWADVVFATGTILANDTIDGVLSTKPTIFYGATAAGLGSLLDHDRYCPYSS